MIRPVNVIVLFMLTALVQRQAPVINAELFQHKLNDVSALLSVQDTLSTDRTVENEMFSSKNANRVKRMFEVIPTLLYALSSDSSSGKSARLIASAVQWAVKSRQWPQYVLDIVNIVGFVGSIVSIAGYIHQKLPSSDHEELVEMITGLAVKQDEMQRTLQSVLALHRRTAQEYPQNCICERYFHKHPFAPQPLPVPRPPPPVPLPPSIVSPPESLMRNVKDRKNQLLFS